MTSSMPLWFCWISFDYRVTLGFGSIAGGLDHVNPVIRLPIKHGISTGTLSERVNNLHRIAGIIGQTKDIYSDNIIDGINIDDLTIEQYLRITQENQTPSMVKKVDDMTTAEYIKYEERMKRQHKLDEEAGYTTDGESVMSEYEAIDPAYIVNTQSFEEELSPEEDLDEWLNAEMEKHISKQNEKNEEDTLIAIIKSIREECRVVHKNKQIRASEADLKKSSEAMEDTINNDSFINDMTQQKTLGTVKNVLVKFDKFEFPCDFIVTDMPENLGEIIILGRPFLETIHAQINVFQEEISFGIGEDRIKFDVNRNPRQSNVMIEKIYITSSSQEEESFYPLEIGHDLFSYESPACFQFEQDTRNYDTIDPQNEIFGQTNPLLDKRGLTKRWHGVTSNQNIPNNASTPFSLEHSELEEKANISESPKLRPFRPCPCDYSFDEWLKVKIGHTNIYDSNREIIFNEWILDSLYVKEEYAKEFGNPYSRRFDEYK
ncbi:reverse transcriptase domain-containing protein [Tanacetum coccineum]